MSDHDERIAGEGEPIAPRFGMVALVGRPNAGKSTLVNALTGEKVSIVSEKPQTTRNRILGILSRDEGQLVFLDTPGIHKPLHRMNVRMMDHVRSSVAEADLVALIVDASAPFGGGDQYALDLVRESTDNASTRFAILNKIDLIRKPDLLPIMSRYGDTGLFAEIVPVSARKGDGLDGLLRLFLQSIPEGPPRFPADEYTTQPERFFASEVIREKLLNHTRDELPYTTAVSVDRWEEGEILKIFATIVVERGTQKKIVVGRGGEMIRAIGTEARIELESILGTRIFLSLHVTVHEDWREDERFLGELEWPLGG